MPKLNSTIFHFSPYLRRTLLHNHVFICRQKRHAFFSLFSATRTPEDGLPLSVGTESVGTVIGTVPRAHWLGVAAAGVMLIAGDVHTLPLSSNPVHAFLLFTLGVLYASVCRFTLISGQTVRMPGHTDLWSDCPNASSH